MSQPFNHIGLKSVTSGFYLEDVVEVLGEE